MFSTCLVQLLCNFIQKYNNKTAKKQLFYVIYMSYIKVYVQNLNIIFKVQNKIGKVSYYLTDQNRNFLCIYHHFPNETLTEIYITYKWTNPNFNGLLVALRKQNSVIELAKTLSSSVSMSHQNKISPFGLQILKIIKPNTSTFLLTIRDYQIELNYL